MLPLAAYACVSFYLYFSNTLPFSACMMRFMCLDLQEAQAKLETDAILDRMCELEQMVDDAGGAMDDIAVSVYIFFFFNDIRSIDESMLCWTVCFVFGNLCWYCNISGMLCVVVGLRYFV